MRARLGGLTTSALGHTDTGPARRAFLDRFYAGVPEDLPAAERDRRAAAARRLHFARLALKSSRARSKKGRTPNVTSGPALVGEDSVNVPEPTS